LDDLLDLAMDPQSSHGGEEASDSDRDRSASSTPTAGSAFGDHARIPLPFPGQPVSSSAPVAFSIGNIGFPTRAVVMRSVFAPLSNSTSTVSLVKLMPLEWPALKCLEYKACLVAKRVQYGEDAAAGFESSRVEIEHNLAVSADNFRERSLLAALDSAKTENERRLGKCRLAAGKHHLVRFYAGVIETRAVGGALQQQQQVSSTMLFDYAAHGLNLDELRRRLGGPLGVSALRKVAAELLIAVDFLHSVAGIAHCDLHCGNAIWTPMNGGAGHVKVCDLGSSRRIGFAQEHTMPRFNTSFAAPELIDAQTLDLLRAAVTPAVDIWSVGVILLSLASGRLPCTRHDPLFEYEAMYRFDADDGESTPNFFPLFTPFDEDWRKTAPSKEVDSNTVHPHLAHVSGEVQLLAFLRKCLSVNPKTRPSAADLLLHDPFVTKYF
jgi:serine/threonine protein kinase